MGSHAFMLDNTHFLPGCKNLTHHLLPKECACMLSNNVFFFLLLNRAVTFWSMKFVSCAVRQLLFNACVARQIH